MAVQETTDYSELLLKAPRECWLALNVERTRVVGTGKTMQEAFDEALRNGVEDPFLVWAPKIWAAYVF